MSTASTRMLPAPSRELLDELEKFGLEVHARATDRLAAAHDGSHYLFTPQAVVMARNADDIGAAFEASQRSGVGLAFRSGGTSLSGQASADGLIVDTRRNFKKVTVLDEGLRVRSGPGATIRSVNLKLARHGRKLGPDPASEIACTVGGVVANNSSGMCCGTTDNSYNTLDSAVFVLPSGTVVDTGSPNADADLRRAEPALYAGLEALRDRIRSNTDSVERIRALYSIKNTMGYGVNAFLDASTPVDILKRLIVGSEGTLAFIAEATFRTVPLKKHSATGLLIFPTLAAATTALPALVASGFAAIELLDATSLRVSQRDPNATPEMRDLSVDEHAALLVEYQEESDAALQHRLESGAAVLADLPLVSPALLTQDRATQAKLWHIRKGLFTLVAGNRPSGTTALLEDVAVPVERLFETCSELITLFDKHHYEDSVIFGHAKDGNIHFMLNERFDDPVSLARYEAFTNEMVDLVLAHGGTLKAEHGTGRIMAPFVPRQFGAELYEVMREIKRLFDPAGTLNAGVLLTDDPEAHLRNLKPTHTVEKEVDRCVECGYCEPVCPSRDLTLTPRQRIVIRREMKRAEEAGDTELLTQLQREYDYDGVQTCAVDGMCATACPVLIDTGDLVRRLRAEHQGAVSQAGWKVAAKQWGTVSRAGSVALTLANAVPAALPKATTSAMRAVVSTDVVPAYSADLPAGGKKRRVFADPAPAAVYFSSCTTTMFGPSESQSSGVSESFLSLCERAGVKLTTPDDIPSLCCGTPWKSKGLTSGYEAMKHKVVSSLLRATDGGRLPVVCDASSCTEGLQTMLSSIRDAGIEVIDAVAFIDQVVLDRLPTGTPVPTLVLHPTCSSTRMGINASLQRVAAVAATEVVTPDDWACCGFAGDRGMLHPELTASATAAEAAEVETLCGSAHASLNRTCELGMTRATGQKYQHVIEVLAQTLSD